MTRGQEDVVGAALRASGIGAGADELVGRDGAVPREVEVNGSDTRMRGVLLAAPDRQRGTRQRDGENGSEQYDSSHSDSLIVATVADARRRCEHTPAPEGVQSAREDESDGRDHRGQGRAAHCAEEERLGRVDDERDRQRGRRSTSAALGLGPGSGSGSVRAPRARAAAAAGSGRAPARPRRARRDRGSAGASARARAARDKQARAPGRSRGLPRRPCPWFRHLGTHTLRCRSAHKRETPASCCRRKRAPQMPGEVGGNPAVPCSRGRPAGSCPRRGISAPDRAIPWPSRRSGRVAEGGALLRRYGGEFLHRGFESLLLRSRPEVRLGPGASRATLSVARRGGRAVECGGLENRYGSLGSSRVQIPPSPLS